MMKNIDRQIGYAIDNLTWERDRLNKLDNAKVKEASNLVKKAIILLEEIKNGNGVE